ncbi:phosphohistidine phosphatase [Beijerinckiaceae bacterium]|nr:phosphohistidine phosphatase [Beijerinckiaceae bacterium]
MRKLLLVRHAEAAACSPEGDLARELTLQGRTDAGRMGAYLCQMRLIPDLALASPARRALDTLDAILQVLPRVAREVNPSLYNADTDTLHDVVAETPGSVRTLLIVGHNPGIAEFARLLVSGRDKGAPLPRNFPAPCIAVIDLECDPWHDMGTAHARLDSFMSFANLPGYDHIPRAQKMR